MNKVERAVHVHACFLLSEHTGAQDRAGEYAGIPNTRISTQAVSRVFQQLLIWNTLEYDVFQVCVADSGFAPADANTREWEHD